eukprot:m.167510 g.167510  ORF g.167510 m.167510 type:complete len:479 (-) comp25047_c0_seq3:94-1530(-)
MRRAKSDLMAKKFVLTDSEKTLQQLQKAIQEKEAVHHLINNEKNVCLTHINSATNHTSEMKERLKILHNELEILRASLLDKEAKLQRQQLDNVAANTVRENLRMEVAKARAKDQDLRAQKKSCNTNNKKELDLIETAETKMIKLREEYTKAVHERNDLGSQLIDRHNELCTLYERINIQESVLRNAEVEMQAIDEELRFAELSKTEAARKRDVLRKQIPLKKKAEEVLINSQMALLEMQEKVRELEDRLVDPARRTQHRKLEGHDLEQLDLQHKVNQIETKLAEKEEKVLERTLVLEEIEQLVVRARKQVEAGQGDTLTLAKRVNDFQARMKDVTRKMMATVSELTMFQAQSLQLQQQVHDKQLEVEEASIRFEKGLPPTEEAAKEWQRELRQQEQRQQENALRQAGFSLDAENTRILASGTRTNALERPAMYMPAHPGSLPVPVPYSQHAPPFKPSETSAHMRHLRKPKDPLATSQA